RRRAASHHVANSLSLALLYPAKRTKRWNKFHSKLVPNIAVRHLSGCDPCFRGLFVRAFISVPLAALFVFLAGFNAWIMLTDRGASPRSRRLWTQAHRICGYSFIALLLGYLIYRCRSIPRIIGVLLVYDGLGWVIVSLQPYVYPNAHLGFFFSTSFVEL